MADEKSHVYSEAEVAAKLKEQGLGEWYLEDGWIRRKYNTDGWPQTLMAVNAIGYLCEAAWHHADLAITWGKLWVKLKTHDAGGITAQLPLVAQLDHVGEGERRLNGVEAIEVAAAQDVLQLETRLGSGPLASQSDTRVLRP